MQLFVIYDGTGSENQVTSGKDEQVNSGEESAEREMGLLDGQWYHNDRVHDHMTVVMTRKEGYKRDFNLNDTVPHLLMAALDSRSDLGKEICPYDGLHTALYTRVHNIATCFGVFRSLLMV